MVIFNSYSNLCLPESKSIQTILYEDCTSYRICILYDLYGHSVRLWLARSYDKFAMGWQTWLDRYVYCTSLSIMLHLDSLMIKKNRISRIPTFIRQIGVNAGWIWTTSTIPLYPSKMESAYIHIYSYIYIYICENT